MKGLSETSGGVAKVIESDNRASIRRYVPRVEIELSRAIHRGSPVLLPHLSSVPLPTKLGNGSFSPSG